jgi:hypothetical protein
VVGDGAHNFAAVCGPCVSEATIRSAPSGNGLCNASASGVSASSHLSTGRRGQDNGHRFGVEGRNDGIGVGREEAEEFVSAFKWGPLRAAHAMPRRPNYIEKEAA